MGSWISNGDGYSLISRRPTFDPDRMKPSSNPMFRNVVLIMKNSDALRLLILKIFRTLATISTALISCWYYQRDR